MSGTLSDAVTPDDPRQADLGHILDESPWTGFQKRVLGLCSIAVILDGLDNQALGFAMPVLIKEWGLERADFVPIVTIGLIVMSIGAAIAGMLGDRFGRRPTLIAAVTIFGLATGATAFAGDLAGLTAIRIIVAIGIGGTVPVAAALLAEYAPRQRRSLAVSIGMLCVPIGGLIGGLIAASVLPTYGWRLLFDIGGALPLVVAAAMLAALPESPRYLARKPERRAELLKILRRYSGETDRDIQFTEIARSNPPADAETLLGKGFRRETIALWGAFFGSLFANYLVFNWAPTMLSELGYGLATASRGLAAYNFGGIVGSLAGSWMMDRYGSRGPLSGMAIGGTVLGGAMVMALSAVRPGDTAIVTAFGFQGFFIAGLQVMLFALAAHVYPSAIRAKGVGMALAVGRLGAVAGASAGAWILSLGDGALFGGIALAAAAAGIAMAFTRRHIPRLGSGGAA